MSALGDHPAIARAELLGADTDNAMGLVETMIVVEDVHGKPVEVTLDHDGVELRVGRSLAMLNGEHALRLASALMLAGHEAKERTVTCPHRLVDEKEVMRGDVTLYTVPVCEDCGKQLDREEQEL